MRFPSVYFSFAIAILTSVGCGSNALPRVVVDGTVTLNGNPVEDGQIRYIPLEGTSGPITIAAIRQGRYRCDDRGGVPLGKHRVELLAWDPNIPDGGRGAPLRPQWAPPKYNENSELTEIIDPANSVVTKNFDIKR